MAQPGPGIRQQWQVRIGDDVVGHIDVTEIDQPWFKGAWVPGPAWERVRERYERMDSLVPDDMGDDASLDEYDAIFSSIVAEGQTLYKPDGTPAEGHLLDIHGDRAGFRWY